MQELTPIKKHYRRISEQGLGSQSDPNTKIFFFSSASQNQLLRLPSWQPRKIQRYVTRELTANVKDPYRLPSARYGLS